MKKIKNKLELIYTACSAEVAYSLTSNDETAIVDPFRKTQAYLDRLKYDNVKH